MTDQQPHTPVIPTTEIVENQFVYYEAAFMKISNEVSRARFRVWLEEIEAAAEQRGAERALREAVKQDRMYNGISFFVPVEALLDRADQEGAQGE